MLRIGHSLHASDPNVFAAMSGGDQAWIRGLLRRQIEHGIDVVDINASAFGEREGEVLLWCAHLAETFLDQPIMLDSADASLLCELAANCRHAPWLNSFELSRPWPAALRGLGERGCEWIVQLRRGDELPPDAATRLRWCEEALERQARLGLPRPWIDAVALPWGSDLEAGRGLLEFLDAAAERWPELRCLVGLSNISYGHRERRAIHRQWLGELHARGLAGALLDPFDPALRD